MKHARLIVLLTTLLISCPLVIAGAVFQSADLAEADKLSAQVSALYNQGKYDEALELAKRVLAIREKALGMENKPVVVALNNIATIHMAQKNYDQAKSFYQRSLAIYEKLNEGDDLSVAIITERLALLSFFQNNHDQAETLYSRSLSIKEKLLGTDHADVALTLQNLGNFYRAVGEHKKAVSIYQRIVAIKEKVPALEESEAAEAREDYACSLRKAGREDEAKKIEERNAQVFHTVKTGKDGIADTSGEILNGKALSLPKPQYPAAAKVRRESSTILVRVLIDESGKVLKACAISGSELFHDTTERSALGARFSPTLKEGKPVKVVGKITYTFRTS